MDLFSKKTQGFITQSELKTPHGKFVYSMLFLIALVMVVVCLGPALWILFSSLKSTEELFRIPPTIIPEEFHFEKVPYVWNLLEFGKFYKNSSIMVVGSIVCAVFFNGLIAYVFSVIKPKGWKFIFSLVLWSMMIPNIISLAPLFINIVNLGLTNRFLTLWLSYGANAFFVLLFMNFFDSIPKSLGESARIDGCSDFGIFWRIYVPLSTPIIVVITIFAFNAAWSDFLLPYLVLQDQSMHTVMIKLFKMNEVWGMSMDLRLAAISFSIVPPAIIYIVFQKWINKGIAMSGGIKG